MYVRFPIPTAAGKKGRAREEDFPLFSKGEYRGVPFPASKSAGTSSRKPLKAFHDARGEQEVFEDPPLALTEQGRLVRQIRPVHRRPIAIGWC